ncbi:Nif3-like dinuclear metal center hexameric protein [Helicobacter sp. 16-1353]|uniref:Nif3-like dinuclear metal center hexameric protein n=1 Tax=Helicobacter sp. 16-1353 TaxID=2004996 RepID=UPI000DCEF379|nr:Nif3-like dinuclear metal center hexameric protein [Helicobacter sp. 16-1353]RAX55268.1 Nif3-like dinuclear metal center hexameric protein [Helicobacter sp. 16-1353]
MRGKGVKNAKKSANLDSADSTKLAANLAKKPKDSTKSQNLGQNLDSLNPDSANLKSANFKNLKSAINPLTLGEIYKILDSISPFELQESWDNSGLIIGNLDSKISHIYLSLEATKEIALNLEPNSLLVTHHPLIFSPLKSLDFKSYPSNIIEILIKKNIALIALHTNFDKTHLNKYFVDKVLDLKDFKQIKSENIAIILESKSKSLESIATHIKSRINSTIKITKATNKISKIAVVCGAGISECVGLEVDLIITGDVKYHDAMKFQSLGVSIIDVGHYNSECEFGRILYPYLKKIHYNAIILDSQNPFIFN